MLRSHARTHPFTHQNTQTTHTKHIKHTNSTKHTKHTYLPCLKTRTQWNQSSSLMSMASSTPRHLGRKNICSQASEEWSVWCPAAVEWILSNDAHHQLCAQSPEVGLHLCKAPPESHGTWKVTSAEVGFVILSVYIALKSTFISWYFWLYKFSCSNMIKFINCNND